MTTEIVTKYDEICIQENINLYGSEHGKVIPILEKRQYIKIDHVEFSYGVYRDKVIITFAGSDEWSDWIDDFKFWKTKDKLGTILAHIHHGFDEQYEAVRKRVTDLINDFKLDDFIISGHSLGGAIATCMALDYIGKKKFSLTTFGSPRVMDYKTATYFNNNVKNSKRFVYKNDLVTHVPTALMSFYHIDTLIPLGKKSFWNTINPYGSAEDHEPTNYLNEIKKILTK